MATLYRYLPELSYQFSQYWSNYAEMPLKNFVQIGESFTTNNIYNTTSIFRLLFDETIINDLTGDTTGTSEISLENTNLFYKLKQTPIENLTKLLYKRLSAVSYLKEAYIVDISGTYDILSLDNTSSDNYLMTNKLLNYRLNNSVDITSISYAGLSTKYSKLVYDYLDLKLYKNFNNLNTTTIFSDTSSTISVLENMFELYLLNESHRTIKNWTNYIDLDINAVRPIRIEFTAYPSTYYNTLNIADYNPLIWGIWEAGELPASDTSSVYNPYIWALWEDQQYLFLENLRYTITTVLPVDTSNVWVYRNGVELARDTEYTVTLDSTSCLLNFDTSSAPTFKDYDKIVIDFNTKVYPENL